MFKNFLKREEYLKSQSMWLSFRWVNHLHLIRILLWLGLNLHLVIFFPFVPSILFSFSSSLFFGFYFGLDIFYSSIYSPFLLISCNCCINLGIVLGFIIYNFSLSCLSSSDNVTIDSHSVRIFQQYPFISLPLISPYPSNKLITSLCWFLPIIGLSVSPFHTHHTFNSGIQSLLSSLLIYLVITDFSLPSILYNTARNS